MGEKLDAAITNVQDFVLDRMGGVMTEQEAADLAGRITLLVNESRFPFEMELIDMRHGVVITVPELYSVEEVIHIRRSFVKLIKTDVPVFVCRGEIKIHKFHADLVIASRRFVEHCYACRGTGVVGQENETPMNCGVCADLRAALKFFDRHNIPQSPEKDTIPPKETVFQKGDPVLYKGPAYKVQAVFGWYVNENGFGTHLPQPDCVVFMNAHPSHERSVLAKDLQPWVHSSSSTPTEPMVFQNGDPVLYKGKTALFDTYLKSVSHEDDRGWHYEETTEPQPQARIRLGAARGIPLGKDLPVVPVEELRFDAPEHDA